MHIVPTLPEIHASTFLGNLKVADIAVSAVGPKLHVHFYESLNSHKHDWQLLSQNRQML